MSILPIFQPIAEELSQVEALLISSAQVPQEELAWALGNLLRAGGKRLRPALAISAARLFAQAPDKERKLIALATSVELLHVATLVHDDLIDNSHLRRGTPTLNSLWKDGVVVLAGDYFFSLAASRAAQTESVPILTIFSKTLNRICTGELAHIFGEFGRWPSSRAQYHRYIYAKTASLFAASSQCGAVLAQAPREYARALRDFGYYLGMAFQIADDLLDFIGTEEELGKPVGSDLRQGVLTLPALYFLEENPSRRLPPGRKLEEREKEVWAKELTGAIVASSAIDRSQQDAGSFLERAKGQLLALPPGPARVVLEALADYILVRRV